MGGHWGHWELRGHWGHTNLKTMINDSIEKNSLFKREIFFQFYSPEPLIPDCKQERPQCPLKKM
ncbi:MAG: hypothetical protein LBB88_07100 [Planctomycetaceae bacterium]|nr:hypothetical protein [Planctomycetaceae bacterium]